MPKLIITIKSLYREKQPPHPSVLNFRSFGALRRSARHARAFTQTHTHHTCARHRNVYKYTHTCKADRERERDIERERESWMNAVDSCGVRRGRVRDAVTYYMCDSHQSSYKTRNHDLKNFFLSSYAQSSISVFLLFYYYFFSKIFFFYSKTQIKKCKLMKHDCLYLLYVRQLENPDLLSRRKMSRSCISYTKKRWTWDCHL